jgi:hypothetical protein
MSTRQPKMGQGGSSCVGDGDLHHVGSMALQLRLFLVTYVTLLPQLEESTDLQGSGEDKGFCRENILDYNKDGNHEIS